MSMYEQCTLPQEPQEPQFSMSAEIDRLRVSLADAEHKAASLSTEVSRLRNECLDLQLLRDRLLGRIAELQSGPSSKIEIKCFACGAIKPGIECAECTAEHKVNQARAVCDNLHKK